MEQEVQDMSKRVRGGPFRQGAKLQYSSPLGPWTTGEVEKILAAAQYMPGKMVSVPARLWWPAFLLVMIDTGMPPGILLRILSSDFDKSTGRIRIEGRWKCLHNATVEAICAILPFIRSWELLFSWPFDYPKTPGGKRKLQALRRAYRRILYFSGFPHVEANLFSRLLQTSQCRPELLDEISLSIAFTPRPGTPVLYNRLYRKRKDSSSGAKVRRPDRRKKRLRSEPKLYRIHMAISKTLLHFFETSYLPLRLADAEPGSIADYRTTLNYFSRFLACDVTPHNLTDDTVEFFLAWLKKAGLGNSTINRHRACILALWRHAWRKRLVDELPRDVKKYRVPKRIPEAWSIADVNRILAAAAETEYMICGIPSRNWWPALLLVLYDTGLRIGAALEISILDINFETCSLSVRAELQKQNADQVFHLHPDTIDAIFQTRPWARKKLFPWSYDAQGPKGTLHDHYRKILKRAGLPFGPRDLFHKFRRTTATAIANVADEQAAKEHLGHSSLNVTKGYIDPRLLNRTHTAAEMIQRPRWKGNSAFFGGLNCPGDELSPTGDNA